MKRVISVLLLTLFLLVSCGEKAPPATDVTVEKIQMKQEEILIPVTVSPYAKENFLLPIDKYSWEKEFDTEYVILHFTSNVVENRENPYDLSAIRRIFEEQEVSIHYIIDRNGEIYCYIPESRSAWHSGVGTYKQDEKYTNKMNKYSVGIELVAIGSKNDMAQYLDPVEYDAVDKNLAGFTEAQYESLRKLVPDICERNNIPFDREHVIGHSQYNSQKADPGELFEWEKIFK